MDLYQGLLLITSIHLLAAATPGPDFVLVSQQTLSNGKRGGLLCSLGIALGLSIHILYSSLGLAAIIANSSSALWAIKLLGGGYLIYLGIGGLRLSLQCLKSKSADLLCFSIYHHLVTRYSSSTSVDLWPVDDGATVCMVRFFNHSAIKACSYW